MTEKCESLWGDHVYMCPISCWQDAVWGLLLQLPLREEKGHWEPEICSWSSGVHSAILKLNACWLPIYPKVWKNIPEAFSVGKKIFQILSCRKWFSIDFLILCLNLCCLALTVHANFLLCKYDRSILITYPKRLITNSIILLTVNQLTETYCLKMLLTMDQTWIKKVIIHAVFLGCDRSLHFLEPKCFHTLLLSFIVVLSTFM